MKGPFRYNPKRKVGRILEEIVESMTVLVLLVVTAVSQFLKTLQKITLAEFS